LSTNEPHRFLREYPTWGTAAGTVVVTGGRTHMNDRNTRAKARELFLDSTTLMTLNDKAGALVDYGIAGDQAEAFAMLEDMGEVDDVEVMLSDLGATYDRLTHQREQAIREYDKTLDGSPRKITAVKRMNELGDAVRNIERKVNELYEAHPHLLKDGAS
jgi:hypothetical protein